VSEDFGKSAARYDLSEHRDVRLGFCLSPCEGEVSSVMFAEGPPSCDLVLNFFFLGGWGTGICTQDLMIVRQVFPP
jgi:hypothetical protein